MIKKSIQETLNFYQTKSIDHLTINTTTIITKYFIQSINEDE